MCFSAVLQSKQLVEQQVKQLESRFLHLVYCTYVELLDKGVNVDHFYGWLVTLDVSRQCEHQEFIETFDKGTDLSDLWKRLGSYWNFLNFDLLEHVVSGFGSEDLKKKVKSYESDLQSFRKATRLCDFIACWPVRGQTPPESELREFVAKVDYPWDHCTLEDLDMFEGVITRKFFLPKFALRLREIKPGSITITWLIPLPFVKGLQEAIESTSSEFFMEHKIETFTIIEKICYPSLARERVDCPQEQYTFQSTVEHQESEKPSVGTLPEELHSFKPGTSKEKTLTKETHRMRLAEGIVSEMSTSMLPSKKIQFDIHPGDTQKAPPSYLKKTFHTLPHSSPSKHMTTLQHTPYTPETSPTPTGMYSVQKFSTYLRNARLQYVHPRFSSEDWLDPLLQYDHATAAEEYVREECVDEILPHVKPLKLLPSVEQYLSKAEVEADPFLPTKYKDYLSSTPAIRAALYTTFNAKVAAEVFTWIQHTELPPPTTMTELFTAFTLKTLVDHLSTHPVYHKQQLKVTTFSDLPTDVYKLFQDLCRIAYEGILKRQQLVFSAAHLLAPVGLMQEFPQLYAEGRASSYHFIHLTLQEYLAAIHISQLPAHEQTRLFQEYLATVHISQLPAHEPKRMFQEHINHGHFKMTMRYVAGHTKLVNMPPDIMMRLMNDAKLSNFDINIKLNYFHCLFEAKNVSMTTRTVGSDQMDVMSEYSWTPLDYYVTGHAISHSNCPWRLKFTSIDDENLELFCQGFNAPGETGCMGHISYVHISGSSITTKSIQSFVNLPTHIVQNMRVLDLSTNKLDGSACGLLAKNNTIKHLDLSNNPIGENVEGAISVAKILVENKTLTTLHLHDCRISSEGAVELVAALCMNTTLKFLSLDHNPIGLEGASSMSDMLRHNTSLEYLYLCDDSVGEEGVRQLINSLKHNQTLRELWLPRKYKSQTSDGRIYWGDSISKADVPHTIM